MVVVFEIHCDIQFLPAPRRCAREYFCYLERTKTVIIIEQTSKETFTLLVAAFSSPYLLTISLNKTNIHLIREPDYFGICLF